MKKILLTTLTILSISTTANARFGNPPIEKEPSIEDQPYQILMNDCLLNGCSTGNAYNEARINSKEEIKVVLRGLTDKTGDYISETRIEALADQILMNQPDIYFDYN